MSSFADDARLVKGDYVLRVKNLSFRCAEKKILRDISFAVSRGEMITILGPNGGGKTTLVKILVGINKKFEGHIEHDDNLAIGYLPQHFNINTLLPMTVEYFLLSSFLSKKNINNIDEILSQIGIGYLLNHQVAEISEGELQKVLLARCLIINPDLIVLDEPVSSMDLKSRNNFYDLISRLSHDRPNISIVMTSHDLQSVIVGSNRIICLNETIFCEGTATEVIGYDSFIEMFGDFRRPSV